MLLVLLEKKLNVLLIYNFFLIKKYITHRKLTTLPKTYQCFQRFFIKKYILFFISFIYKFFS
jgi:hypothetical protein